jgi:malate dehydrogenase (oxaloacetate-decarboxylating)
MFLPLLNRKGDTNCAVSRIAECNNALIYPGLGFGAVVARTQKVTDTMIITAARRLASLSPALKDPDDLLLPDFQDAPQVNFEVAVAVVEQAIEEGVASVDWKKEEARMKAKEVQWEPVYAKYVYDPQGQN